MDLWNNSIGRKYGLKVKDRKELLKLIHKALDDGELITEPDDPRKYQGKKSINKSKPIAVISESESGRNQLFYNTRNSQILTLEEFVALIQKGEFLGYAIKEINGVLTPVSKPDSHEVNNLG